MEVISIIHNKHDTSIRTVLMNKREASIFINEALKLKKINEIKTEVLEMEDNRFITKSFYNKETDIIYKIRDRNTYILIEHQSKVDKQMAKRIIEYIVEIIRRDEKEEKIKREKYKLPLVIPIVLYTGKEKWTAKQSIIEIQEKLDGYDNKGFGEYIIVDTNKYSKEKLLRNKGVLSKIILLDKAKNRKEMLEVYDEIEVEELSKGEKEIIKEYICNISTEFFRDEEVSKLRGKYEEEEGGKKMLADTIRMIRKQEGRKLGKRIAKRMAEEMAEEMAKEMAEEMAEEMAKKMVEEKTRKITENVAREQKKAIVYEMIKQDVDIKFIKQCTKLSEEDIEEVKKSYFK